MKFSGDPPRLPLSDGSGQSSFAPSPLHRRFFGAFGSKSFWLNIFLRLESRNTATNWAGKVGVAASSSSPAATPAVAAASNSANGPNANGVNGKKKQQPKPKKDKAPAAEATDIPPSVVPADLESQIEKNLDSIDSKKQALLQIKASLSALVAEKTRLELRKAELTKDLAETNASLASTNQKLKKLEGDLSRANAEEKSQ